MQYSVTILPYDPNWPDLFESEAHLLKQALGKNCIEIHHIGSTSIPGLCAKPIIDILPVVENILDVDLANFSMEALGYQVKGEHGIAFRRFFQKGKNTRTHNVHVYEKNDPEISRYLKFRNWMCSNPEDAAKYAQLKLELAKKFPEDLLSYCLGKDAFVAQIDAKDGFNGTRMVQALTDREWASVGTLRQQEKAVQISDTLKNKDNIHFVFYSNSDIIGYAHIELHGKESSLLKVFSLEKPYQGSELARTFFKLCERWISHIGIQKLYHSTSFS